MTSSRESTRRAIEQFSQENNVSLIKPLRALRPGPGLAEKVSCPPYDVVYDAEARRLIDDSHDNFIRVTRPEADFPPEADPTREEIFLRARDNLAELRRLGVLVEDEEPCYYIYRLEFDGRSQTGIVACCSLDEYRNHRIKPHENTRPDKVNDRTAHLLTVRAQTGLIFLAFRGTELIGKMLTECAAGEPLYDFTCDGGVRHTMWRAADHERWTAAFAEVDSLYVADGHHRIESAERARETLRAANAAHTGEEEYNFVMAGIFPAEGLRILAYNRVVSDLNGLSTNEFIEKVGESYVVQPNGDPEPPGPGCISMYLNGKWYSLRFNVAYFREPDAAERLDVERLQQFILGPILGISDPRTDERLGFVGGRRGVSELESLVDSGNARVAFSMYPTSMDDLILISDRGEIMPPKSTWFEPKLRDGLIVHSI